MNRALAVDIRALRFAWPGMQNPLLEVEEFFVRPGEKVFIKGTSGCGKTTLLNLIGGILKPQTGAVHVLGVDLCKLSERERDTFRSDHMGMIFQMFNLIPYLSVAENVVLPCHFSSKRKERVLEKFSSVHKAMERLMEMLQLSLADLAKRKASELSVGQQQRVAIARALIGTPEIVIADEPTSSLDEENRHSFLQLLFEECDLSAATLLFVSHDGSLAKYFDRCLDLRDFKRMAAEPGEMKRC